MTTVPITTLRERRVYENRFVAVNDDDVEFPGGARGRYLRITETRGRPGVAVLARCANRYALVLTYRYPTSAWEWAIPRGFAHGEDPVSTARGELAEELGAAPDVLTSLGTMTPNSGLLAATVHLFEATYGAEVRTPADTGEVAAVRWVDLDTLRAEILDGRIVDGFTLAALAAAAVRGLLTL